MFGRVTHMLHAATMPVHSFLPHSNSVTSQLVVLWYRKKIYIVPLPVFYWQRYFLRLTCIRMLRIKRWVTFELSKGEIVGEISRSLCECKFRRVIECKLMCTEVIWNPTIWNPDFLKVGFQMVRFSKGRALARRMLIGPALVLSIHFGNQEQETKAIGNHGLRT